MPDKNTLATLFIQDLITDLLKDRGTVEISERNAHIITSICNQQWLCYVQFLGDADIEMYLSLGHTLPLSPVLWEIGYWRRSSERWVRGKIEAEERRRSKFIEDENIRRVSKRVRLTFPHVNEEQSRILARQYLNNKDENALKFFNVGKLVTKMEEI
jgi:hypothetical protein